MKIKVNQDILISSFLVILAGFMITGTVFLCKPLVKAASDNRAREKFYVQEIAQARSFLDSKDTRDVISRLVPRNKVGGLAETLKQVALKSGVTLLVEKPPFTAKDDGQIYRKVLYYMKSTASLKHIGEFLANVRIMPDVVVDLDSLRLIPDEAKPGLVSAKMAFVVFAEKK
jgi:hypothetical protein